MLGDDDDALLRQKVDAGQKISIGAVVGISNEWHDKQHTLQRAYRDLLKISCFCARKYIFRLTIK